MKQLLRLAGIWIVLFSFTAESTGAASLGLMSSPMAARQLMPPPAQQVLRAVPVKAAPAPKLDPKVVPPAEWGFYVLAAGELAAIEAGFSGRFFKDTLTGLKLSVMTAVSEALLAASSLKAKLSFEESFAGERLAPIDLAAPIPPAQPAVAPAPAPTEAPTALFAPGPKEDPGHIMLVREPLFEGALPRGWGARSNSRPATAPPVPVAPWPPQPARGVPVHMELGYQANQAAETVRHEMPVVTEDIRVGETPVPSLRPINDPHRVVKAPTLGFNWARGGPAQSMIRRVEGAWNEGKGIRYRIIYLDPLAFSQAGAGGIVYNIPGKFMANPSEKVPPQYWGNYPIYHHGQQVDYQIEVENTGKAPLSGLTITAAQEVFNQNGGPGIRLPTEAGVAQIKRIKPGERVKLGNSFKVTSDWTWHGSLEQTHVRVTMEQAGQTKTLAEAYQAGIIDPPPDL